jgi:hypothetical protein
MEPDEFNRVVATHLNETTFLPTADGRAFGTLKTRMRKDQERLVAMFEGQPEILKDIEDVVEYGDRLGEFKLGPSTAKISSFRDLFEKIKGAALDEDVLEGLRKVARGEDLPPLTAAEEREVLTLWENFQRSVKAGAEFGKEATGLTRAAPTKAIERALKAAQVVGVQATNPQTPLERQTRR